MGQQAALLPPRRMATADLATADLATSDPAVIISPAGPALAGASKRRLEPPMPTKAVSTSVSLLALPRSLTHSLTRLLTRSLVHSLGVDWFSSFPFNPRDELGHNWIAELLLLLLVREGAAGGFTPKVMANVCKWSRHRQRHFLTS